VTIYQGQLSHSIPVAIKEQGFDNIQLANSAIQEAMAMSALSHPGILKVYDCAIEKVGAGGFRSILVVERMERDLGEEIRRRRELGQPWTDAELITVLKHLVAALSFAQKQGISHRDIKPCNIMLSGSTLKIGDFGSSTRNLDLSKIRETIQGSPFFLSPELKREYARMLQSGIQPIHYDPVRSDVYSLGVTMLEMAYLEQPAQLINLQELREETYKLVVGLGQYPHLQPYLAWMLEEEIDKRPTFVEIEEYMQTFGKYYDQLTGENSVAMSPNLPVEHSRYPCEEEKAREQAMPGWIPYPPNTYQASQLSFSAPPQYQSPSVPLPSPAPLFRGKCAMCTRNIPVKTFEIPEDLLCAVECAPSVCSQKCFIKMWKIMQNDSEKCSCCDSKKRKKALVLGCGHWFHNKDCLFQYMFEVSHNFLSKTTYQCPLCPFFISYPKTIVPYFGETDLRERVAKSKAMKCSKCSSTDVDCLIGKKLFCGPCAQRKGY
jgi:serine/threonine protein kinase